MIHIEKDIKTLTYRITLTKEEIDTINSQDGFNTLITRISHVIYKYIKEH